SAHAYGGSAPPIRPSIQIIPSLNRKDCLTMMALLSLLSNAFVDCLFLLFKVITVMDDFVENRQHHKNHESRRQHPSNHHTRQRLLRLSADAGRKRSGQ